MHPRNIDFLLKMYPMQFHLTSPMQPKRKQQINRYIPIIERNSFRISQ